jgi:CRISPR-associated protein Cas2
MFAIGYGAMWTIVCFDLPTEKPKHKKACTHFRRELLAMGFSMLQYSVYARFAATDEIDKRVRGEVFDALPP